MITLVSVNSDQMRANRTEQNTHISKKVKKYGSAPISLGKNNYLDVSESINDGCFFTCSIHTRTRLHNVGSSCAGNKMVDDSHIRLCRPSVIWFAFVKGGRGERDRRAV